MKLFILLVLGSFTFYSNVAVAEKYCAEQWTPANCSTTLFVACQTDSDCTNGNNCCHNGCAMTCSAKLLTTKQQCKMPPKLSNEECHPLNISMMYHYNYDNKKCECYLYSGCGKSPNLYSSLAECERTCGGMPKPSCKTQYTSDFCQRAKFAVCVHDKNCTTPGTRCCNNGCASVCAEVQETSKPKCATQLTPEQCRLSKFATCMNDSTCTGGAKCCSNGCGINVCSEVASPTEKICQEQFTPEECILLDFMPCDDTCGNGRICCNNGCTKVCGLEKLSPEETCALPPMIGNQACKAYIEMFTYNTSAKQCQKYIYGGCGGSQNLFNTQLECQNTCENTTNTPKPGSCPANISVLCKKAVCSSDCDCGGLMKCCGNGCMCVPPQYTEPEQICKLPPVMGEPLCKTYTEVYTFNYNTKKCQKYKYGGCRKTQNLFTTKAECKKTCGIFVPPKPGVCDPGLNSIRCIRQYCNSDYACDGKQKCCGNGCVCSDPYKPGTDSTEICKLPPVVNNVILCRASIPKFTFNAQSGECDEYIYGGCNGTANLFDTLEECEKVCLPGRLEPYEKPGVCPPMLGKPCLINTTYENSCEFDLNCLNDLKCCSDGCNVRCTKPIPKDICSLPPVENNINICKGFFPKFTYDQSTGTCISYTYGGCKGTENLFDTLDECLQTCGEDGGSTGEVDICSLPPVVNNVNLCRGFFPKFTFKYSTGRCESYTYGGCNGTANLFDTKAQCEMACNTGGTTLAPTTIVPNRPGQCPAKIPDELMDNAVHCNSDDSCPVGHKCCPSGHQHHHHRRHYCIKPCCTKKLGKCPCIPADSLGICANLCNTDDHCPGMQKCCRNNCGASVCADPFKRLGLCPNSAPFASGLSTCYSDGECDKPKKCCPTTSGKNQCMEVYHERPGRCPEVLRLTPLAANMILRVPCNYDHECEQTMKCCSKMCTRPLFSNPCTTRLIG